MNTLSHLILNIVSSGPHTFKLKMESCRMKLLEVLCHKDIQNEDIYFIQILSNIIAKRFVSSESSEFKSFKVSEIVYVKI